MFHDFTVWFVHLVVLVFGAFFTMLADAFIYIFDVFTAALMGLLALLPSCGCFTGGLQSVYVQLHPGVAYMAQSLGVPSALAFVGAAVLFRLARKAFTLFQW